MGKHLGVAYNLRLSQELKDKITESAKELNRSMNADIVARLEESFLGNESSASSQSEVKIIHLNNGKKRVIFGKLLNTFDLDYTQSLSDLKIDIELALDILSRSSFLKSVKFFNKNVLVHQGNNHLDVVNNGVGSLNWLIVEDH